MASAAAEAAAATDVPARSSPVHTDIYIYDRPTKMSSPPTENLMSEIATCRAARCVTVTCQRNMMQQQTAKTTYGERRPPVGPQAQTSGNAVSLPRLDP